jgi:hypothetical protein
VKPTLWLADYAKASDGKVDSLGGGWTNILPHGPFGFFVAGTIEVPWNLTNEQHTIRLDLLDADGQPIPASDGENVVHAEGMFELGRPPGTPTGTPLAFPVVIPFGPLTLEPGRYEIRLTIGGESREGWHLAFNVLAAPPQMMAA